MIRFHPLGSARSAIGIAVGAILLTMMLYLASHMPPTPARKLASTTREVLHDLSAPPILSPELQGPRPLTTEQARALNEERPLTKGGLQRSFPFRIGNELNNPVAYNRALSCLTAAVYYEAGSESEQGQRAIAQVVLNRVRHPSFPASICEVVYQGSQRASGCQFTFTCDGSLARRPNPSAWDRARKVAENALAGAVEPSVGMATHYHALWVVPYWTAGLEKIARVGEHIFYRWPGYWGLRQSFTQHYAGEMIAMPGAGPLERELLSAQTVDPSDILTLPSQHPSRTEIEPTVAEDESLRILIADKTRTAPLADGNMSRLVADTPEQFASATVRSRGASQHFGLSPDGCTTLEHQPPCLSASVR